MRPIALALCAFLLSAPATAMVNLIADGGFEADPAEHAGYSHIAGGTALSGVWHVTGVDILHVDTAFHAGAGPVLVFNAHGGRNSVDLTGTGNSSPLNGIYQDVATQAGTTYKLSFWVGRAMSSGSVGNDYLNSATLRMSINGGAVQDFVNDERIDSGIMWKQFTSSFIATDDLSRIAFLNGEGNDYLGLDDVVLGTAGAVPEPAPWAMTVSGLGIVGGALRRTRRTTAAS